MPGSTIGRLERLGARGPGLAIDERGFLQKAVPGILVGRREHPRAPNTATSMSFFDRLKANASAEWHAYTHHPFTDAMAAGSLPEGAFRHYLIQDYLFLIEFARAYALAIY